LLSLTCSEEPAKKKAATAKTKAPAKPKANAKKGVAKRHTLAKSDEKVRIDAHSEDTDNGENEEDEDGVRDMETGADAA